jgi:DNA primase
VQIAGREVQITNRDKVFFPVAGYTKGDLLDYYLAVAEGALRGVANRPMALKRFVQGADGEAFFQKRAPANRPPWIETAVLSFPSGRTAEEIVVRDAAQLAWVVNLGCIDSTRTPFAATISIIPTNCGSTSTRRRVCLGRKSERSRWRQRACSMTCA